MALPMMASCPGPEAPKHSHNIFECSYCGTLCSLNVLRFSFQLIRLDGDNSVFWANTIVDRSWIVVLSALLSLELYFSQSPCIDRIINADFI